MFCAVGRVLLGVKDTRSLGIFFCGSLDFLSLGVIVCFVMESLTKHWSNMLLNDRESGKVSVTKE